MGRSAAADGAAASDGPVARFLDWVAARAPLVLGTEESRPFVLFVGLATFICGFFLAALLNAYLLAIHHPLVEQLRSSLNYESAILGDGLVLPIVNMTAAAYLYARRPRITRVAVWTALLLGWAVTTGFHVDQAVHGIVNWAMPTPWHWNILGGWHALYMLSVTSWLSLFLVVVVKSVRRERAIPAEAVIAFIGVAIFFGLLRLDYISLDLRMLIPMS